MPEKGHKGTGPVRIVVMGVSAAGKSTVGMELARRLEVAFVDSDALHPSENVKKMSAGVPLDDQDRAPWLERVGEVLADAPEGVVMACSALKRGYRDIIRRHAPDAIFVHLHGSEELLKRRADNREGHFMPPGLLASQLETLEPLEEDEAGAEVDVADLPDRIAADALRALGRNSLTG